MGNSVEEAILDNNANALCKIGGVTIAAYRCDTMGYTALQTAYSEQCHEATAYLLTVKEALMATNFDGDSYIDFVIKKDGLDGLLRLEKLGFDVCMEDEFGNSMMHHIVSDDSKNHILLKYLPSWDINKCNVEGLSILAIAAITQAHKNLKSLVPMFPEQADELLRFSVVTGNAREYLQAVVDKNRLHASATELVNDENLILPSSAL
jgi:hypothetical protein